MVNVNGESLIRGTRNRVIDYDSLFTIYDLPFTKVFMSAKLSVIFYIVLCLEIGIVLTLLPWIPQGTLGLSEWGNNYFLLYATRKTGMYTSPNRRRFWLGTWRSYWCRSPEYCHRLLGNLSLQANCSCASGEC